MKTKGGIVVVLLKILKRILPGSYLKTFVYLNFIALPRKLLRQAINTFYRIDHIYEVIKEFKKEYKGDFSILEFGVADGYTFVKKLYAVRYLNMEERIIVHGFDSFEGLPEETDQADKNLVGQSEWRQGQYKGRYENLKARCEEKYNNFRLHKGYFEETITDEFLESLRSHPPMLIWIDCDYYSSAKTILERIIPFLTTGCVLYFDDIYFNYSSRLTGEMKLVWEINHGKFGEGIELVPDTELNWNSNRIYRFININQEKGYELVNPMAEDSVRLCDDESPLP